MASPSSMNSDRHAPNPPPRIQSRPNQPPPPPPLPSMPPVPPPRETSRTTLPNTNKPEPGPGSVQSSQVSQICDGSQFLSQFQHMFKPVDELPPPDPFMNKPKTYHSHQQEQKRTIPS